MFNKTRVRFPAAALLAAAFLSCSYTYASVTKQYQFCTSASWEGNGTSGVALAMRHKQQWYYHVWAHGLGEGDEHPACAPVEVWLLYLLLIPCVNA